MAQKKNQKREPTRNKKQEQLDRDLQRLLKANEKHWNDLQKSNDKKDKSLRDWIASNADLYSDLTAQQQADILAGGEAATAMWDNASQRTKDYQNIQEELQRSLKAQYDVSKKMHVQDQSITANTARYNELIEENTRASRRKLAIMDNVVDRTNQISANALMIGTSEFQSLDLSRDIAKAKAEGDERDVERLERLQQEQRVYAEIHKQIDETAKLIEEPFTWLDGMIKQIPIIGGLLSSLIPFESWGKELSDSFREGASEQAAEDVTGKTRKQRKEDQDAAEQTKKETEGKSVAGATEEWQEEHKAATEDNTTAVAENTEAMKSNADDTTDTTEGGKSISDLWNLFSSPRTAYVHVTNFGDIEAGDKTEQQFEQGTMLDASGNPITTTGVTDVAEEAEQVAPTEPVGEEDNWSKVIANQKKEKARKDEADDIRAQFASSKPEPEMSEGAKAQKSVDEVKPLTMREKLTQKMKEGMQKVGEVWGKLPLSVKLLAGAVIAAGVAFYKMWSTARDMGIAMNEMPLAAMFLKDEAQAILDEFGSLRDVSSKTLITMKWQSFWTGVQAKDMATILALQTATTSQSKDMGLKTQAKWIKEITKEGLSANKVLADMAANADFMAEHMRDGGENIKNAAKHMAKMGLSLQEAEQMANSLLDWETSINSEMEASVILGRSLNFERARSLMYNDKIEEAMKEIKNQVGGEAEFARMSSTQRKVLGESIGLQGEALAKFMQTQEQQRKSEAQAAAEAKKATRDKIIMWSVIGGIALATIFAIGGALWAAISIGAAALPAMAAMTTAALSGAAIGGTIGLGVGMIGGGALAAKYAQHGMDEVVAEPTMILAGEAGPEHVEITPSKSGPPEPSVVNIDTTKMEQQNEKIIELLVARKDDAIEQARKQKGATLDAGKQR